MTSERRHYDRIPMALPFCMHVESNTIIGKTANVSMNGVCVSVTAGEVTQLGSGTAGKCQLSLNNVHVTLDCEILRVKNQELAIQFKDIGSEKFNLLRALLAHGSYAKDVVLAHRNSNTISAKHNLSSSCQTRTDTLNCVN
ncbi:hypothetical protein TDB9533_00438 [Thalassocella blandensis]|nr:hypothetical protein TDB9533_00438 [Thalassocella blandensis]